MSWWGGQRGLRNSFAKLLTPSLFRSVVAVGPPRVPKQTRKPIITSDFAVN